MADKKILVLTYWSFDTALIQTYTLPYVKQMVRASGKTTRVYLFTLSQSSGYSVDYQKQIEELKAQNIYVLHFSYRKFGIWMAIKMLFILMYLILFTWRKGITHVHAWCTPGGAIGYLVSKLTGRPLILDSFEPHAETMLEGNTWNKNSLAYRILFSLEKKQLARASEVICAAPGMIEHSVKTYGIRKHRYFVKPACVDLQLFDPAHLTPPELPFKLKSNVCVYAGKFGGIYLEKEVFDFFKTAFDYWNGDFSVLLLTSHSDDEIARYCEQSGFPASAMVKLMVPHRLVPSYMKAGTFGFCPVKPLPSKLFCTPIKNGEYWAMGLPVIITNGISTDSEQIENNNMGYVLKRNHRDEYIKACRKLDELKNDKDLLKRIREHAIIHRNFKDSQNIYATIYA